MTRSPYPSLFDRLLANSLHDEDSGCWLWLGAKKYNGYGVISIRENGRHRKALAHRIAYQAIRGPIPPLHDLDHATTCVARCCINPEHLRPVPYLEHRARTGFSKKNAPTNRGVFHSASV